MHLSNLVQYFVFLAVVSFLVKPLGTYMACVFSGKPTVLDAICKPIESFIYRLVGIGANKQMTWKEYALGFILISMLGSLFLYVVLRAQAWLPWFYPKYMNVPMTPDLAMNTAISFVTTSTWQAYGGENTMSYLSQMLALVTGNFLGGASGLAVGIAFIRAFADPDPDKRHLGNFYVDFFRALIWILLPASILGSMFLVSQGVPMNFNQYTQALSLEGKTQVLAQGPVAALEFIKNLGTNGGGFFNVNGAHPYANPSALTNFVGMLAIAVLPASLTYTFGYLTKRRRDGWALYAIMVILFTTGLLCCNWFETNGNPIIAHHVNLISQGNMEGKEVRFGIAQSVLSAEVTSTSSTGSYNSMHDSFTPLGGFVPLINMLVGQFFFGGLGGGIYGIIFWVLLTMFVVGLMVGRTPEYIGKKIGATEMKLVVLYTLATPLIVLVLTAIAVATKEGLAGLVTNTGPHGLSEIICAYASSNANNGQNFAGLNANTPFYNVTTAIAMMVGRFCLAIPALALAARVNLQPARQPTVGTMPSDTPLFVATLLAVILIMGCLSYMPLLVLGPVVENYLMHMGWMI